MRTNRCVAIAIAATVLSLSLAGCGIARRQELQERNARLKAESAAATQACNERFPKGQVKTVVVRIQCLNDAFAILRPMMPYPDLMDLNMATRVAIAERIQSGQVTMAQGNEEMMRKQSEIVSEEQRRLLANRAVRAQENIADASLQAAGPHSCTQIGNTVNCF
jgi:hypothetical protein